MHLLYVTAALPLTSGETHITPEILEVQRRGHRITVVPTKPLRFSMHEDARKLVEFTVAEPVLSVFIARYALAEMVRSTARVIRAAGLLAGSRNVRIFFKNLAVFPKGLWLARICRERAVDHIHAHWAGTSATLAMIASCVSGIPWSLTAHRWDISENNLLERKAQMALLVRAIDVQGARELAEIAGPHKHKVRVIHMGVVCTHATGRNGGPRTPLRVLLGARFAEVKGHRYALEAMARLKTAGVEASLDCAGDGPLQVKMEEASRELNVHDCVRFLGLIDHRELVNQLREHRWDVALLPSIRISEQREGIPLFLIEAMGAGVPAIGTITGGIPELLEGAGLLIPERDSGAIAEAVTRLAIDSNLWHQLAQAGARRVRDEFTIETSVSVLLQEISSGCAAFFTGA